MSKIVIDARESGTTTGRYVDKLIEHLHKLELTHQIIVVAKPERVQALAEIAPKFVIIETPFREFSFGEQWGLLHQLKNLNPDLVHFGMVQQPILYRGKAVTTMHDLTTVRFRNPAKNPVVFFVKQQVYKGVNWLVPRTSKKIIVPSNYVRQDVAKFAHINPDKVVVTYESADTIPDKPEPVIGLQDTPFIMYVGRPLPHKNLPRLIEAFKQLKKTHSDLRLVLGGKKDVLYESIERAVHRQGLKDIVFTGFVSEGQLRWLYEHCQAYIFPSLSEGFGLPGVEAMVHGAPVVSSNATCLPEVYGEAAEYFDPYTIQSIVLAIDRILTDDTRRAELVRLGSTQAATYSWQRMAEQTLAIYEEVLSEK